jgi:hypothetical protein
LFYKKQILDITWLIHLLSEKLDDDEENLLDKNELEELDNDLLQILIKSDDEYLIDLDELEIFL